MSLSVVMLHVIVAMAAYGLWCGPSSVVVTCSPPQRFINFPCGCRLTVNSVCVCVCVCVCVSVCVCVCLCPQSFNSCV